MSGDEFNARSSYGGGNNLHGDDFSAYGLAQMIESNLPCSVSLFQLKWCNYVFVVVDSIVDFISANIELIDNLNCWLLIVAGGD